VAISASAAFAVAATATVFNFAKGKVQGLGTVHE
jgi:hypothetical protein